METEFPEKVKKKKIVKPEWNVNREKVRKKNSKNRVKLTKKQEEYIRGILSGKTKKQAALEAGYAETTATVATQLVEANPLVQKKLKQLTTRKDNKTIATINEVLKNLTGITRLEPSGNIEFKERSKHFNAY